ncbi:MAG TPA: type II toxin-antitoxin system RelE/ParE family toxin [Bacteroidales bacterium]|nr:type II toxin-antitoxin system RelE/ParE family toxin [Bacteroidales bacterium]HSA43955.1 type II toxin-antitoxin system RelE/ParE family toxin [Bacteroidales bacterium]
MANDSRRYAKEVVQSLFESVQLLASYPKAGRVVPEFGLSWLRELIMGSYRVVYKIVDKYRIDILTVHHSARLLRISGIVRKK